MLAAEAAARGVLATMGGEDHASVSSIDGWEHYVPQEEGQAPLDADAAAARSSDGNSRIGSAENGGNSTSSSSDGTAVYAPGAPAYGTFRGGPGSIPHEVEERVHEVSSTGAAISLALLLQHRSEQEAGSGSDGEASSAGAGEAGAHALALAAAASVQQVRWVWGRSGVGSAGCALAQTRLTSLADNLHPLVPPHRSRSATRRRRCRRWRTWSPARTAWTS